MKPLQTFAAVLTASVLLASSASAQQSDSFAKGNAEYAAGKFREAIELYDGVVRDGQLSAALFYNLGNAWYRAEDLGRAILNYERALALQPRHPEALANLRLVRDKARALELRQTSAERLFAHVTPTQWTMLAAIFFWLAAFPAAALLLRPRRYRAVVALLIFSALACVGSLAGLRILEHGSAGRALAIVTADKMEARLAAADNAGTVLALPAGSEIKILSRRGEWIYAVLPNDLRGWIPAQSAERVRL